MCSNKTVIAGANCPTYFGSSSLQLDKLTILVLNLDERLIYIFKRQDENKGKLVHICEDIGIEFQKITIKIFGWKKPNRKLKQLWVQVMDQISLQNSCKTLEHTTCKK